MKILEMTGLQTNFYSRIKNNIQSYLLVNDIKVKIHENNDIASLVRDQIHAIPMIKYKGHTLTFNDTSLMQAKLNKLYFLLKNNRPGRKEKCISCDGCRCGKDK